MEVQLTLINLIAEGAFVFQFFPSKVSSTDRANWNPQETTIGVKPLFFANRDPRRIDFDELWLDNTATNESLTPQIKRLREMMQETERGTPPPLLAAWGDRNERCVLEELNISEEFFNESGAPIRVRVSLKLIQLQPESGTTSVRVLD